MRKLISISLLNLRACIINIKVTFEFKFDTCKRYRDGADQIMLWQPPQLGRWSFSYLSHKLDWTHNKKLSYKNGQNRFYLIRKLGSFRFTGLRLSFSRGLSSPVLSGAVGFRKRLFRICLWLLTGCCERSVTMDNNSHHSHSIVKVVYKYSSGEWHSKCKSEQFCRSSVSTTWFDCISFYFQTQYQDKHEDQ